MPPPPASRLACPSAGASLAAAPACRGGGALKATSSFLSASIMPCTFDTASAADASSSYSMYARPLGLPSLEKV